MFIDRRWGTKFRWLLSVTDLVSDGARIHMQAWDFQKPCCSLLLLLLSHFSRVQLCVTPQMAAHQALPSLGFSRQEHWSGLPFPFPMHECEKWKWSRSVVSDPQRPHGLQPIRLFCPWDFPGKSTGVECHCLLLLIGPRAIQNKYFTGLCVYIPHICSVQEGN